MDSLFYVGTVTSVSSIHSETKRAAKEITVVIPDAKLKESITSRENKNVSVTKVERTCKPLNTIRRRKVQLKGAACILYFIWKDTPEGIHKTFYRVYTWFLREALELLKPSFKSILAIKKLTVAYMEKVLAWPAGETEYVCLLQSYALFLCGCINAIHDLQDMSGLDMSANLKVVISKPPFKLRARFRSTACDIREKQKCKLNFNDTGTTGQALVWHNFGGHSSHWKRKAYQKGCEPKKKLKIKRLWTTHLWRPQAWGGACDYA